MTEDEAVWRVQTTGLLIRQTQLLEEIVALLTPEERPDGPSLLEQTLNDIIARLVRIEAKQDRILEHR